MDDCTGFTVTGGTSLSFTLTSDEVPGGVKVADHTEADFRLRRHITFKNRNPRKQADGTFSKGKRSKVFTTPVLCSDNVVRYIVTRTETEIPVEASAIDVLNHRRIAAQLEFDADIENFNVYGTIS